MKRPPTLCLLFVAATLLMGAGHSISSPTVSTFSIVAIDPASGDLGIAVASRYFSVGSVVPWSTSMVTKEAALRELRAAAAADPGFRKQLETALERNPDLKALKDDKEFLARLFPQEEKK